MSLVRGSARRRVVHGVLGMLLALSAVMLLASPLLPHGPACQLKARVDCTACTLDSASGAVSAVPPPVGDAMAAAPAAVIPTPEAAPLSRPPSPTAGRAPPA